MLIQQDCAALIQMGQGQEGTVHCLQPSSPRQPRPTFTLQGALVFQEPINTDPSGQI